MAIDDNTSYELTGYQVKDLAGRIRRKAEASSVPTSISDLGQVTSSDIDWSTINGTGVIRLGDILIQYGRHNFGSQNFNNNFWGSLQRSTEHLSFTYPIAFASEPMFTYSLVGNSQGIIAAGSDGGGTASTSPLLTFVGGSTYTGNATPVIDWFAIGKAA